MATASSPSTKGELGEVEDQDRLDRLQGVRVMGDDRLESVQALHRIDVPQRFLPWEVLPRRIDAHQTRVLPLARRRVDRVHVSVHAHPQQRPVRAKDLAKG